MILSKTDPRYQQCAMTVMDNIADPDIRFNSDGISNYYFDFKKAEQELVLQGKQAENALEALIKKIKTAGKDSPYDCIMGLSGGVDSSYVAYQAKQFGLRPLAVHFDNGWDSELAVMNIENIVSKLNLDLYTLVVNWEEFRDLQLAYLKASVIDIEVVTDHAIAATLFQLAKKYKVKYVLSGSNVSTEYLMPKSWIFNKADHINLKAIHKAYGSISLKTYPIFNSWLKKYCSNVLHAQWLSFLNLMPYNKKEVKAKIAKELGWRDYGGKHYESIFTRFYQAYILPEKFKVDKRKPHLSNLICSDQISREEALADLEKDLYEPGQFKQDYEYVLKKFDLTKQEFENIMHLPIRKHEDFPVEKSFYDRYILLKPIKPIIKGLVK